MSVPASDPNTAPTMIHNLPARRLFIGREQHWMAIREALSGSMPVVSIDGLGGIGKTALILETAYRLLDLKLFDWAIWATASGRQLTLNDLLDNISRTLNASYVVKLGEGEKFYEVDRLLRTHKCLVVVDNLETVVDVALHTFLSEIPPPSRALLSSRYRFALAGKLIPLTKMTLAEAIEFMQAEGRRQELGAVAHAPHDTMLALYDITGGMPLAIQWAIGHIRQTGQPIEGVIASLAQAKADVFPIIFNRSWELLSNEGQTILRALPIFKAPTTRQAIAAITNLDSEALERGLGDLVRLSLLEINDAFSLADQRFSIHSVTRSFAQRQVSEDPEQKRLIHERFIKYYFELAELYGGNRWSDYDRLEEEFWNLLAAWLESYNAADWARVIQFRNALADFIWMRGHWHERIEFAKRALEAAAMIESRATESKILVYDLGWTSLRQGNLEEAKQYLTEGRNIYQQIKDREGEALAIRHLGKVAVEQHDFEEAYRKYEESMNIFQDLGNQEGIANLELDIGWMLRLQHKYEESAQHYNQAMSIFKSLQDDRGIAKAFGGLGNLEVVKHDYKRAYDIFNRSLLISEKIGRSDEVAHAKWGLALLSAIDGDFSRAIQLITESNEIYQQLGTLKDIYDTQRVKENIYSVPSAQDITDFQPK